MGSLSRKVARTQFRRRCIYCDSDRNITKEHFWPQWLDSVLAPRTKHDANTQIRHGYGFNRRQKQVQLTNFTSKTKQGHTRTKTVDFVCESCNAGWMSKLQSDAKTILTPLILGEDAILSKEAQYVIAQWITMTAMTAEFTDAKTAVISFKERDEFRSNRLLRRGWCIWIGKYEGSEWNTRYRHHRAQVVVNSAVEGGKLCYAQSSTFVVGNFMAHCHSCADLDVADSPNALSKGIALQFGVAPLYPVRVPVLDWGALKTLGDAETLLLADGLILSGQIMDIPGT